ncbi:MAG: hypothetical protein IPI85_11610 [Dehalococcoidia bacterium]|nr:hypothetical protein [Dehalococcoidia bacterium]
MAPGDDRVGASSAAPGMVDDSTNQFATIRVLVDGTWNTGPAAKPRVFGDGVELVVGGAGNSPPWTFLREHRLRSARALHRPGTLAERVDNFRTTSAHK